MQSQILNNLISTGAITLAIIFVGRKLIEQIFSRDLEKFKSDLEKDAFRFRTRFEKLHAERAETIKNLYQKIIIAERNLADLIHPFQPGESSQEEKAKLTVESVNDLVSYFYENRIFLDGMTERSTDRIVSVCREAWQSFDLITMMKRADDREYLKEWSKLYKEFSKESPKATKRITKKFREILGTE